MKILKTIVSNGATTLPIDTISYTGGVWLVPQWIASPDGRCLVPDRIVRIDRLSLRALQQQPWDYHLLDHVPNDVLFGARAVVGASPFEVIDRPADVTRDIDSFDSWHHGSGSHRRQ
jgi:hypothetical protein